MSPQKYSTIFFLVVSSLASEYSAAQDNTSPVQFFARSGKGIGLVTSDSAFSLNFQFRMQNRAAYVSQSLDDLSPESFEFRVRRLRMKFEGFVYDPRLTYYIQLSFSRGDMDWRSFDNSSVNSSPNVVRDAVIYYSPLEDLRLGFGQTKLPGNRQRVVSSGDLQFADRSIVNAAFNIDRDFGFFAQYTPEYYALRAAVTSGEGRNAIASNQGLAYTGRLELLPLGRFTGNNDYIEGDLAREPLPKISVGFTYHYNAKAVREAGALGNDLYEPRTLESLEADLLLKYNGWAWYNEYMERDTDNPITIAPENATLARAVAAGRGYLTQLSYIFKNNLEIAGRYSRTVPSRLLNDNPLFPVLRQSEVEQIEAGVTKYLNGHRLKIQGNIIYSNETPSQDASPQAEFWSAVFQIELGI